MLRFEPKLAPFRPSDREEVRMRSALAFPRSFKCPTRIYYGNEELFFDSESQKTARLAREAGIDVQAIEVTGDHHSMLEAAIPQAVSFFLQQR